MNKVYIEYTEYRVKKQDSIASILGLDDIDYYSGGAIEQAEKKIDNLIHTVECLVSVLVEEDILSLESLLDLSKSQYRYDNLKVEDVSLVVGNDNGND